MENNIVILKQQYIIKIIKQQQVILKQHGLF